MATCCNCGNTDDNLYYYWDAPIEEDYYWDAPIEEDYDWRDAYPDIDCMCEICFDIANEENKIKWLEVSKCS